jgi:hypothetical protein
VDVNLYLENSSSLRNEKEQKEFAKVWIRMNGENKDYDDTEYVPQN